VANEEGKGQGKRVECCNALFRCTLLLVVRVLADLRKVLLERDATEGDSPITQSVNVIISAGIRVGFLVNGVQIRRYISPNPKYGEKTDSGKVQRWKVEKKSERIVKRA